MVDQVLKSDSDWKKVLTKEEYHVLREKGTEIPFSGRFDKHFEQGMYTCRACGAELFDSSKKYDAGCGWPSFDLALPGAVVFHEDNTLGMNRTEVTCARCGGHLGHVFPDAPAEVETSEGGLRKSTGQRFCINSVSLGFNKKV